MNSNANTMKFLQENMPMETPPGAKIVLGGRKFLYFGGTAYYCLQSHPDLLKTAASAMMTYGTGTGTAIGDSPVITALEKKTAQYFGTKAAVTFPAGYMSSAIGISSLTDQYDRIFIDEATHYAGLDGVRLVDKPVTTFKHLDHDDLKDKINANLKDGQIPLLVSDGIFPTFGTIAPVDKYAQILEPYTGLMWLDDAHAAGVIGQNGRGTYDHFGIISDRCFFGGTFAKAFGGFGGFIPGSENFINHIKTTSNVLNGASRIDIPSAAAAGFGLDFLLNNPQKRQRLSENSQSVKNGIRKLGIKITDTPQPVTTFALDNPEKMAMVHKELINKEVLIQFTNYIGGPPGGVLRITVFSEHTKKQIQYLLDTLEELIKKY